MFSSEKIGVGLVLRTRLCLDVGRGRVLIGLELIRRILKCIMKKVAEEFVSKS